MIWGLAFIILLFPLKHKNAGEWRSQTNAIKLR